MKFVGLAIWVHGRQFSDSKDYWQDNWLNVTARYGAQGASVKIFGNIIHLSEIAPYLNRCSTTNNTKTQQIQNKITTSLPQKPSSNSDEK